MKISTFVLINAALVLLQLTAAEAQTFSVKSYRVSIGGTSTLHDWQSNVESLECDGSIVLSDGAIADINEVTVKIPVKSIKSTKGRIMDSKTWEAFDYQSHPFILFVLTGANVDRSGKTINVSGKLTMAGVTKSIDLTLSVKPQETGRLLITGSKTLLMTDYNMVPPTAMMGTIKVGPEVTVSFEVIINPNDNL